MNSVTTASFSPEFPDLLIDLVYPNGGEDQEAPSRPVAGWPVIVWLHGGGWRLQDRLARPNFHRFYAPLGFVMASID